MIHSFGQSPLMQVHQRHFDALERFRTGQPPADPNPKPYSNAAISLPKKVFTQRAAFIPPVNPNLARFPQAAGNPNTANHLASWVDTPNKFVIAVLKVLGDLPPAEKPAYQQFIRNVINLVTDWGNVHPHFNRIGYNELEALVFNFLPKRGEELAANQIGRDFKKWLKNAINFNISQTPDVSLSHGELVSKLILKNKPNWAAALPPELAESAAVLFFPEEIAEETMRVAAITKEKQGKLIGFLLLGGFGVFGISQLMGKKKKARK